MNPLTKVIYSFVHLFGIHPWYLIPLEYVSDTLLKSFNEIGIINISVCKLCGLLQKKHTVKYSQHIDVEKNTYIGVIINYEEVINSLEAIKKRNKEKTKYRKIWEKDKIKNTFFDKSDVLNIDKMEEDKT